MEKLTHQDYKELRAVEYQVVIAVEYDDGRMFPLTEDMPIALLPVGNRPLLSYQLDMLVRSGVNEIIIAAPEEYNAKLVQYRDQYLRDNSSISIDIVPVTKMMGAADGLRAAAERIRGDFILIKADFISQFCIGELTKKHRLSSSDLTMMLTSINAAERKKDDIDKEYIGVCDNSRIVMKTSIIDIDEYITVTKPLISRCSGLAIRSDLIDVGVYVMSHWILEFLQDNRKMTSIASDVIPYMIQRQFQSAAYLYKAIPSLQHRNRTLEPLEDWLTSAITINNNNNSETTFSENYENILIEKLFQPQQYDKNLLSATSNNELSDATINSSPVVDEGLNLPIPSDSNRDSEGLLSPVSAKARTAITTSTPTNKNKSINNNNDLLRCYGVIYENDSSGPSQSLMLPSSAVVNRSNNFNSSAILFKVRTVNAYLNLNKDILLHKHSAATTPWNRLSNYMKKELSVIGDGSKESVTDSKNVTVKQCCIGSNCKIGNMVKLNNCVVMDNVIIGDSVTIQNSILCTGCEVASNCKINDCSIGVRCKVPSGTKVKNEAFSDNM